MPNIKHIFAFIFSFIFYLSVYLFTFVVCSKVVGFSSIRRESQAHYVVSQTVVTRATPN